MRKKGRSKYPQATINAALDMVRGGSSLDDIAAALSVPRQTLYSWARRAGIKPRSKPGRRRCDYDAICRSYMEGCNVAELAQKFECTRTTIHAALDAGGVQRRENRRTRRRFTAGQVARVVARYKDGDTLKVIAADLGTGSRQIRRVLLEEGIPLRRRGGGDALSASHGALQRWRLVSSLDDDETWEHKATGKTCDLTDRGAEAGAERFVVLEPEAGRFPSREQALKGAEKVHGINL